MSLSCRDKLIQAEEELETTGICFLTVWRPEVPSRGGGRAGPCWKLRGASVPVPSGCWLVDTSFQTHGSPCLPSSRDGHLPVSPVLARTPAIGWGPTPGQCDLILTSYISKQGRTLRSWGWDVARVWGSRPSLVLPKCLPSRQRWLISSPSSALHFLSECVGSVALGGRGRCPWWALRPGRES